MVEITSYETGNKKSIEDDHYEIISNIREDLSMYFPDTIKSNDDGDVLTFGFLKEDIQKEKNIKYIITVDRIED